MQHASRDDRHPSPSRAREGHVGGVRFALSALAASLLGVALSSCALYDDTWSGGCLLDCEPVPSYGCTSPLGCAANETCGDDAQCHPGNCNYWGCVAGYSCAATELDTAECVRGDGTTAAEGTGGAGGSVSGEGGSVSGEGGAGGAGAGPTGTGGGGSVEVSFCGSPGDCAEGSTCGLDGRCARGSCEEIDCIFGFVCDSGACVRQNAAGCAADEDCSGEGERCISGLCTVSDDLCFDGVQCATGSSCADGACVPSCAEGAPCPDAFLCDEVRGICSTPASPCTTTADCGDDDASVCVDGACVPRAVDRGPDTPPGCSPGEVWVDNGCIPDQRATFSCTDEGEQSDCANGLLCVHRTCFVPCEPPNEDACKAIPGFETCKDVPAVTGDYAVCAADAHLGGECDLTRSIACDDGLVCVDGTCL